MSGFPQKFYHAVFWPIRILMGFAHPIVHVRGLENIPDGPAVICCNHSSFSDAIWVIVCSHQKRIFRTMAKKELFSHRVLGWFITKLGAFPVDREANDIHAVKTALGVLREGDKRRYDSFLLREEPYIGICAAGHRFAGRRVSPEELLSETLLLREPGSGTRSILERELMQVSYNTAAFSRTICISSFPVIRALTAANCGISFLYEAVVRGSPEIGSFTCPPLTGRHELNVVFLQHTGAGSLAREFVAPVMEQFP